MDCLRIPRGDPRYPAALAARLGEAAPASVVVSGNLDLLRRKMLALLCSVRCPGKLILQTYDFVEHLRQEGVAVIGGFHSPMERECLRALLRGPAPVVVSPARGLGEMRLSEGYLGPLEDGRLLLLSCLPDSERRITAETAAVRNRFVAALADAVFVAHAEPGGKTEAFCHELLARGTPLYTLEGDANANLLALGAKPLSRAAGPSGQGTSWPSIAEVS